MRVFIVTMALIASAATEVAAAQMTFHLAADVFETNSVSASAFRVGTTVASELTVDSASSYAAGVRTFDTVSCHIFGDGLFNHPLFSGFVLASDNHSLIEPGRSIDEVIIVLADAAADRPIANGGHGIKIDDPRGGPTGFRTIGVRLRLTGPASWFDGSSGPGPVLAVLPRYQAAESWAEFEDFALGGRAYADFQPTRFVLVPEPSYIALLAVAYVIAGRRAVRAQAA
jgi:hypothetical protein